MSAGLSNNKVLINAVVFTANSNQPWAQAVVIKGNKFEYVGDNEGAKKHITQNSEVINLDGKFVTPGLIDGHMHPLYASVRDASRFTCGNNVRNAIREHVDANSDEEAIFGLDLDPLMSLWEKPQFINVGLNRHFLDELCPDKPAAFLLANAHEGVCNSIALSLAHVNNKTPDFDLRANDFFERDEKGDPTGYFVGRQSVSLILESYDYFSGKMMQNSSQTFFQNCFKNGITSVVDCGNLYFAKSLMRKRSTSFLNDEGSHPRMFGCGFAADQGAVGAEGAFYPYEKVADGLKICRSFEEAFEEANKLHGEFSSDSFTCNFMKVIYDGINENFTDRPGVVYDEGSKTPVLDVRDLRFIGRKCAKAGLDLNVHATCSDAIHNVLVATGDLRARGYDDLRVTISHSTFVHPDDFELFAKFDVMANSTGSFIPLMSKENVEKARARTGAKSYPLRSIRDAGGKIGLGTDCPCVSYDFNPLVEIEQAITRKAVESVDGYVNSPEEGISLEDAILAYTINNAYQVHMENKIGSLEVGKLADLVIFEKNPFQANVEDLHKIKVYETIMDGVTRYKLE